MSQPDWSLYGKRNASRNRLLLAHHVELVDYFLRVMQEIPVDKRVLDVGPANGFFLVLLRELGFANLEGMEISPTFAEAARSKNLNVALGNIVTGEGLDQLSPPYDIVLMMEVLEHLEAPGEALLNARQLLNEDGFLYLTVPICAGIFDRLRRMVRGISRKEQILGIDETHINAFSRGSLTKLLARSGFTVKEIRRVSFRPPGRLRYCFDGRLSLLLRALLPESFRGFGLSVIAEPTRTGS